MVRSLHKTKTFFAMVFATMTPALVASSTYAANPQNLDFRVNIAEVLTVSVTEPANWATGDAGNLLRNKIHVSATTNNPVGVVVSMYTNNTELRNTASYNASNPATYIPTLASSTTKASFPENYWGYSIDDQDSESAAANYNPLKLGTDPNPITLFDTKSTVTPGAGEKDVFFGAKINSAKQSGTYAQTVYFAAVTGTIDTENPVIPTNPSEPNNTSNTATYSSTTGNTTYTRRSTSGSGTSPVTGTMNTVATEVAKGDVTSAYANAAGVTSTTLGADNDNTALVAALATGAAVSAVSGIAFFAAAKVKNGTKEG